jgi:hypothetical protein
MELFIMAKRSRKEADWETLNAGNGISLMLLSLYAGRVVLPLNYGCVYVLGGHRLQSVT